MYLRFSVLVLMLFLVACSNAVRNSPPAPVLGNNGSGQPSADGFPVARERLPENNPQAPKAYQEGNVVITPLRESPVFERKQAAPNKAVTLLLARATQQQKAGDISAAARSLERAVNIQSDNAKIWNRLAHLRKKQKKLAMAAQMAARSNALAGAWERDLKLDNWQLIAEVKRQLGDKAGARVARQRVKLLK